MTQQTTPGSNAPTFETIRKEIKSFGEDAGRGADGYVKMLVRLMEGAYHGALDLTKDKHGTGVDDAMALVGDYNVYRGNTTMFKGKNDKERKALSNGRKAIKLGACTRFGAGQPLAAVNDLMNRRNKLFSKDANGTDDAANTFLKFATAQLKSDTLIDGDSLDQFCRKSRGATREDKAIIRSCIKQLQKLGTPVPELKQGVDQLIRAVNAISIAEVAAKQQDAA